MPLTSKGDKILHGMEETYGSKEKAESVLYASKNAGKIAGIDSAKDDFAAKLDAACAGAATLDKRADMVMADDHRVYGGVGFEPPLLKTRRPETNSVIFPEVAGVVARTGAADDHRVIGGVQIQPNASQIANTLGMRFDENGVKIPMPKDPKERAEYEAAIKRREAAGGGKFVGDK